MQRRELTFTTYDEVITELDALAASGCRPVGRWGLGQTCRHLSYYLRGSLEGYDFKLPWVVRKTVGRPLLKRLLREKQVPEGNRTIPASVFETCDDEAAAVAECRALLERLRDRVGDLEPSPLFDELTPDQWRELHLLHAAHHFSFLLPAEGR